MLGVGETQKLECPSKGHLAQKRQIWERTEEEGPYGCLGWWGARRKSIG